ncbi:hypothetical protein SLS62_002052 [Diatrype stigma]|uniref:Uncharacterized protein n=1 Tax=Diatrype stigma TaxID=117547 RepID=A0AAN9YVN7_9PEZI
MEDETGFLERAYHRLRQQTTSASTCTSTTTTTTTNGNGNVTTTSKPAALLPSARAISAARASLPRPSDGDGDGDGGYLVGRGPEAALDHVLGTIAPALNGQNLGPAGGGRYFGLVTGSTLPVAEAADNVATAYDQNVQVHLPGQTIATEVEDAALRMVADLLELEGDGDSDGGDGVHGGVNGNGAKKPRKKKTETRWQGRTFTTGATASNVLGLACGREAVIRARLPNPPPSHRGNNEGLQPDEDPDPDEDSDAEDSAVGELGLLRACALAQVDEIRVLTSAAHSSVAKAAAIVGLGRASLRDLGHGGEPWRLDLDAVARELADPRNARVAHIVSVSAGEVNTGRFATAGLEDMRRLRALADEHRAWIHVDGAFGLFNRILPKTSEFAKLRSIAAGLELADSITADGHKLLNVPYDNGIFFTRKASTLRSVFKNPNAAYLAGGGDGDGDRIESPLHLGIENSRRFRALPVYAALLSEGRAGMAAMVARMVRLARRVAAVIQDSEHYALLLPPSTSTSEKENHPPFADVNIIVLFRARDDALNESLAARIQATGEWYVSPTKWRGQAACRVAVASWRADVDGDAEVVRRSLAAIAEEYFAGR